MPISVTMRPMTGSTMNTPSRKAIAYRGDREARRPYHVAMLSGFLVIGYGILLEYRHHQTLDALFDGITLRDAKARIDRDYNDATRALVAAVEAKDAYTRGHSSRVSEFAVVIADQYGLNDRAVDRIRHAAVLHDIGKIAVSEQIREGLDVEPGKVVCIHNGIDHEAVRHRESAAGRDPGDDLVVGAVGRLTPVKGYEYLLRAMPDLIKAHPHRRIRLVLVGDGPLAQELIDLARELELADRVELAGHLEACLERVARMDVVVFPSLSEGLPMALLEALALERPVVATRVGGIPEIIRDGENGLLVDARDVAGLSRACGRVLSDAALAVRLGRAGRETECERFSAQRNAALTARLYRESG